MRNSGKWLIIAVCFLLAAGAWAGLRGENRPHRYAPGSLDQEPVTVVNPVDGTVLAAWGYREGGEYSIALAMRTGDVWSEPVFIGRFDRLDQIDPALAFDRNGVAYLAYTVAPEGVLMVTAITGGLDAILEPQALSQCGSPAALAGLLVIGDRLAVAFQSNGATRILDLPLVAAEGGISGRGIQEGPDAVDPLGWTWGGNGKDSDEDDSGDRWESEDGQDPEGKVPLGSR